MNRDVRAVVLEFSGDTAAMAAEIVRLRARLDALAAPRRPVGFRTAEAGRPTGRRLRLVDSSPAGG